MIDAYLSDTRAWLRRHDLSPWANVEPDNPKLLTQVSAPLAELPQLELEPLRLDQQRIVFGSVPHPAMATVLQALKPWRKGPVSIAGIPIDSEWDCSHKWHRLAPAIAPRLAGSNVLDIGGGNGYFAWRCLLEGAASTLVVDPNPLAWAQWLCCKHFVRQQEAAFLPLRLEALPHATKRFELILCLGVVYHSPAPFSLLRRIRSLLAPGGCAVIESIVIDGDAQQVFTPTTTYASMPNVWAIPSALALERWLVRCGFSHVEIVAAPAYTQNQEQSASEWSQPFSLIDTLDSANPKRTKEGYPAPQRAVLVARV